MPKARAKEKAERPLLAVLDGNALIHRAFHALPPLTSPDGKLVNAVYGFTTTLLRLIRELKPTHVAAAFDRAEPTFRHQQFAAYKAQRVHAPDELYEQIPITQQLLACLHVPVLEAPGFEADDVIGTVARRAAADGFRVAICTGDLDTLQLVTDAVTVHTMRRGLSDTVTYTPAAIRERFGFGPEGTVHYKALRGDPSDNIPGVPGVGEKTAAELIKRFKTVDRLYAALRRREAPEGVTPKLRERLLAHEAEARQSLELVTIRTDVPLRWSIAEAAVRPPDAEATVALLRRLGFNSLLPRLGQAYAPAAAPAASPEPGASPKQASLSFTSNADRRATAELDYRTLTDPAEVKRLLSQLRGVRRLSVDTETTALDPTVATLLGVSLCWEPGHAFFISTVGPNGAATLRLLKPILQDSVVAKVGHNLKFDIRVLSRHGVQLAGVTDDSLVAAYLLSRTPRSLKLDDLVFAELGHRMQPITELIGPAGKEQGSMADVPLEKLGWYAAEDADFSLRLVDHLRPRLHEDGLEQLYAEVEVPLVPVLAATEDAGVLIDASFLAELSRALHRRLKAATSRIYGLAETEFNIGSPAQLKEILFGKLALSSRGLRKTAKGSGTSTAADELEKLAGLHPIIPAILEHRELSKLLSTYVDALPQLVSPADGRVHTSFNQTVTATGRLSSSDPNLQNIPIRTETGRQIRQAFIAPRGWRLVGADYSQIELRVIASLAGDSAMLQAFRSGEDIHRRTAAAIFGCALADVTFEQRRIAKEINFGIIYGLGGGGLAQRTGLAHAEAREFIAHYFSLHPDIERWLAETKARAAQAGYVETVLGRRRYLPDIHSGVPYLRAAAERMAVNMPIQGTAADIMKVAMVNVARGLPSVSPRAKLILQVHDELVVEAPSEEAESVASFLGETMERACTLDVPVKAEVHIAKRWGEMKG